MFFFFFLSKMKKSSPFSLIFNVFCVTLVFFKITVLIFGVNIILIFFLKNRTLWKKCCFSGDGEYICAGKSNYEMGKVTSF